MNDILIRVEEGVSVIYAVIASGLYQGGVFDSQPSDGVYRSTDGGQTWDPVLTSEINGEAFAVADLEMTDSRIYAGTMRNLGIAGGGRIFSSSDGMTWEEENTGYVNDVITEGMELYGLDIKPGRVKLTASGNYVYAALTSGWLNNFNQIRDHSVFTRLMRKDEITGDWQYLVQPETSWASIPWHAMAMAVDPSNPKNLTIGGLDLYNNVSASNIGELSWIRASDWVSMYAFSPYLIPYYGLSQEADSLVQHFVHADIHAILFGKSSDELLIATDGGIQYTDDYAKIYEPLEGDRLTEYPSFRHVNKGFATTQYYTIALNPAKGSNEVLAGSQDNSTHTSESGEIKYSSMIGGGDGAYCFFDRDDPQLRITSSQSNAYNIWIGNEGNYLGLGTGTFINPGAYDDRSNLLYVNMMVDGGFEALNVGLQGRYIDTLGILNMNAYLNKDTLNLDRISYLNIGSGSQAAFSALKTSPHDDALSATLLLGNQLGDVYLVKGLPYNPSSSQIDNGRLPVGYISAVDFGDSNDDILVSFSNYGVSSVWLTRNGGKNWVNLDRDLPDIPVRDAHFSPFDDRKIIIATEVGIWGLENTNDEAESWVHYNAGLPNVRVDMLDIRESDSTIAIATHGRGVFLGKYQQGERIVILSDKGQHLTRSVDVYPNPTSGYVQFTEPVSRVDMFSMNGVLVRSLEINGMSADLSSLRRGIYIMKIQRPDGKISVKRIMKQD